MELVLLLGGVVVSILVEFLKTFLKTSRGLTILILIVLSLLTAIIYHSLQVLGYWESVWQILVYAGAVYAFIIKNAETLLDK